MEHHRAKILRLDAACVALLIASCTGIQADSKLLFVGCGGLCVLDPEPGAVPSAITWETPERDFTDTDGKVLFTGVPVWDGESISNAVWSPDGTVLAVTTVWGLDGQNSILTVQPDGTNAEAIVTHPCCSGYAFEVSPDGQTLAYTTGDPDHQIYLLSTATRESSYLTDGYGPEWSPDGSTIAFLQRTGWQNSAIRTIRPDGSGEQIVYEGDLFGEIDWSPRLSSMTSVASTSWGILKREKDD